MTLIDPEQKVNQPRPRKAISPERLAAHKELLGLALEMKGVKDAQFSEELERLVRGRLLDLYERDLLTQREIRETLLATMNGRPGVLPLIDAQVPEPRIIRPRAYRFRDPATIPTRPRIMGEDYMRGYVSATAAPGGIGKSALVTAEILALVTGKRFLGRSPLNPCRVWYLGEDDQDELDRRFAAAMKYYGVAPSDIGGRLFVESLRDTPLIIATQSGGITTTNIPDAQALLEAIRAEEQDVLVVDPVVKTHRVAENDNGAMDQVYTAWSNIAHRAACAVHLIVHTRKSVAGQEKSIEDMRGAGAQLGAVRSARLLVRMEKAEAQALGIDAATARQHIRIADNKVNMAKQVEAVDWFKLHSVCLGNQTDDPRADNRQADEVQVVDRFKPPALFSGTQWEAVDGIMRALEEEPRRCDPQAKGEWFGHLVAEFFGIELDDAGRSRVKAMIKSWEGTGAIEKAQRPDKRRQQRPHYILGNWRFGGPEVLNYE